MILLVLEMLSASTRPYLLFRTIPGFPSLETSAYPETFRFPVSKPCRFVTALQEIDLFFSLPQLFPLLDGTLKDKAIGCPARL